MLVRAAPSGAVAPGAAARRRVSGCAGPPGFSGAAVASAPLGAAPGCWAALALRPGLGAGAAWVCASLRVRWPRVFERAALTRGGVRCVGAAGPPSCAACAARAPCAAVPPARDAIAAIAAPAGAPAALLPFCLVSGYACRRVSWVGGSCATRWIKAAGLRPVS